MFGSRGALEKEQRRIEEQLAADCAKLAEREERRAFLVGTWLLSCKREWFEAPEQQNSFMAWLRESGCKRADLGLFAPDADDDLVTHERLATLAAEAGAADLFEPRSVDLVPHSETE